MKKDNKCFSLAETAKNIARLRYGKTHSSQEEADRDLLRKADLGDACLLAMVNPVCEMSSILKDVVDAVADVTLERRRRQLWTITHERLEEFVSERELQHGPCPRIVRLALLNTMYMANGRDFIRGAFSGGISSAVYPDLPEKGTEARKEYDRWMKRKPKPKERHDGEN
jgi:hypothetical protein